MSFAALMVHVDVDGELGGEVHIAADLAGRLDAHVIGVAGWAPMSVFLAEEAREQPTSAPHLNDMRTLLEQKGGELRAALKASGRAVEWRAVLDFPAAVIAREARAADLVIVGRDRRSADPFRSLDLGQLVLSAGRPVLVVPPQQTTLPLRRAAIAWKETREARRAVYDALPLLRIAQSVVIVDVREAGDEHGPRSTHDLEQYLRRHGLEVVTEQARRAEVTVTDTLLHVIEAENVDLLVAGAYGHSRVGEWIFGGVTRDLLRRLPICGLFSH